MIKLTFYSGNYLVRVRAQVMTRDDSSGGWVPLSGGGLANVSVRRRPIASSGSCSTNGTSISTTTSSSTAVSPVPSTTNARHSVILTSDTQGHGSSSSPPGGQNKKYEYLIYGKRITDQSVS